MEIKVLVVDEEHICAFFLDMNNSTSDDFVNRWLWFKSCHYKTIPSTRFDGCQPHRY